MHKNKRFTTPFDRLAKRLGTGNVGDFFARMLIVILLTYIGVVTSMLLGEL